MDFICLILFLLFYFFRPQEWISMLGSLHPVQLLTAIAVLALFLRDKGLKAADVLKTPHDWLVFAYFAWTVFASPTHWETFLAIPSLILFYVVGVQSLSNLQRIRWFLGWWAGALLVIAALALSSEYTGFDPFDSYRLTHYMEKGRLALNLSIFNNPNGLAHSLVPVIPMIYFIFFWKNFVGKLSSLLLVLPFWCIYLTQSKGAFLSSFVTIITTLTFGRPKVVQITFLSIAGIFGTAALYALPRMHELHSTKSNEAIAGRVAAFKFGYESMQKYTFGLGLAQFAKEFSKHGPMERYAKKITVNGKQKRVWGRRHYSKAPHSSFNQTGAELGYVGLILFISILYSCLATLISMSNATVEEERIRRALFAVVIAYVISSWLVDFGYRPTFFLFVAATAALHRIVRKNARNDSVDSEEIESSPVLALAGVPKSMPLLSASQTVALAPGAIRTLGSLGPTDLSEAEENKKAFLRWNRLGLKDLLYILILTWAAEKFWLYSIANF